MQPRSRLKAFEANPDKEFDFYLVEKLGWRSVAEMRANMSGQEYAEWSVYFARKANRQKLAQLGRQQKSGMRRAGRR